MPIDTDILIFSIVLMAYCLMILWFYRGWKKMPETEEKHEAPYEMISVLIAFRNEYDQLSMLLNSLKNQYYPSDYYEIILVDDHSTDSGAALIDKYQHIFPALNIRYFRSSEHQQGKKDALKLALQKAKGTIILQTDADCVLPPGWIASYASAFKEKKKHFFTAGLLFQKEKSLQSLFFRYEFASLIASGAGSLGNNKPLMCNGANLGYRKSLIENEKDPYHSAFTSGDDAFLMLHCLKKYGAQSLGFIKNPDAVAQSLAPDSLKRFFSQRMRWTSKAGGYKNAYIISVALMVFIAAIVQLALYIMAFLSIKYLVFAGVWMLLKSLFDILLTGSYLRFSGRRLIIPAFFVFEWVYPFYILATVVLTLTKPYQWKNRSYSF